LAIARLTKLHKERQGDETAKMRRKAKGPAAEQTHFGKAFEDSGELLNAEVRLATETLSQARRKKLLATARKQFENLENLTERDRKMTAALAEYFRQFPGEMKSYRHFSDWCADRGKFNDIELRTLQYWLQNQYAAQGKRGRPKKMGS
jgi:hypothetical protein